jgi:hypothetical protein
LVTRVVNHYAFFIFFQISLFSIAVGYLIATLQAWGVRKIILLALLLVISLNRETMGILMFAWKDSFMTVLITFLCPMMINIFLSKGEYLSKFKNIFFFAIIVALTTVVRHNGFFFTMPLLFLVFVFYIRKNFKVLYACVLSLLFVFLIKVPLYSTLKITYPNNTYVEAIGVPMTIMCDLYKRSPEHVPTEVKLFLENSFGTEKWNNYVLANYNSIKFTRNNLENTIKDVPIEDFAKMTISSIKAAPKTAFLSFVGLTDFIWGFTLAKYSYISYPLSQMPIFYYFINRLGVIMMLFLFVGLLSLSSKNGVLSLILIVPSVVHNALTMLLLCGEDHRFFHFNVVITFPLIIALLICKNNKQPKQNE